MAGDPWRYADGQNTRWALVAYGPDEYVAGEFPITRDQLFRVRELFDYGDDLWIVHCYEVSGEMWPELIEILGCPPPDATMNYFVEGCATDC